MSERERNRDCCPVCGKRLTGCGIWNPIVGELCSLDCLDAYWEGQRPTEEVPREEK